MKDLWLFSCLFDTQDILGGADGLFGGLPDRTHDVGSIKID